jgi:hypothetical protein
METSSPGRKLHPRQKCGKTPRGGTLSSKKARYPPAQLKALSAGEFQGSGPCGPEALKPAGCEQMFGDKVLSTSTHTSHGTEIEGLLRGLDAGVIRILV